MLETPARTSSAAGISVPLHDLQRDDRPGSGASIRVRRLPRTRRARARRRCRPAPTTWNCSSSIGVSSSCTPARDLTASPRSAKLAGSFARVPCTRIDESTARCSAAGSRRPLGGDWYGCWTRSASSAARGEQHAARRRPRTPRRRGSPCSPAPSGSRALVRRGVRLADLADHVDRLVLRLVIRARQHLGEQPVITSCTPVTSSTMPSSSSGRSAIAFVTEELHVGQPRADSDAERAHRKPERPKICSGRVE